MSNTILSPRGKRIRSLRAELKKDLSNIKSDTTKIIKTLKRIMREVPEIERAKLLLEGLSEDHQDDLELQALGHFLSMVPIYQSAFASHRDLLLTLC